MNRLVMRAMVLVLAGAMTGVMTVGGAAASTATCAAGGACAIGDVGPGGGIVFLSPSSAGNATGQFFEAAPNTWDGAAPDGTAEWCNASSASVAGLGNAIGDGRGNTTTLSAACASTGTLDAAEYVAGRTIGGLTGWFLPSQDEMLALYSARSLLVGVYATNQATVDDARYLTSSQSTAFTSNAIGAYMEGSVAPGTAQDLSKSFAFSIRPMRMFTAAQRTGGSGESGPADVIQQIGRLKDDDCSTLHVPELDWAGATGSWSPSWAEWAIPHTGGWVCTRTLRYVGGGRWSVV